MLFSALPFENCPAAIFSLLLCWCPQKWWKAPSNVDITVNMWV